VEVTYRIRAIVRRVFVHLSRVGEHLRQNGVIAVLKICQREVVVGRSEREVPMSLIDTSELLLRDITELRDLMSRRDALHKGLTP